MTRGKTEPSLEDIRPDMELDLDDCIMYGDCLYMAACMDMRRVCTCGGELYRKDPATVDDKILAVGGGRTKSVMPAVAQEDSFEGDVGPLKSHKTVGAMVGETFGRMTLVGMSGSAVHKTAPGRPATTVAVWRLICDCGQHVDVTDGTVKKWINGDVKEPMCRKCQVEERKKRNRAATSAQTGAGTVARNNKDGASA